MSEATSRLGGLHLCVVSTAHALDDVRVTSKMVASFLAAGCRVTWVGPDLTAFGREGRLPGVDYRLVPPARNKVGRVLMGRRLRAPLDELTDVDWYYAPTPDAVSVALRAAQRRGGRVLYDLLEAYHVGLLDRYTRGRGIPLLRRLVQGRITRLCAKSDLVSYVSEPVRAHYTSPDANFVLVRSCAPSWFADAADGAPRSNDGLRVMHGKAIDINGTHVVLEALAMLAKDVRCEVVMFPGPESRDAPYLEHFWDVAGPLEAAGRLVLIDPVPHHDMPALTRSCDLGLIAYPRSLGAESLPNRLFEYMAQGLAVAAPSYSPEIAAILSGEDIGRTVDAEDSRAMADLLLWAATHRDEVEAMGRRAQKAFLLRHNWESEFDRLADAMVRA